MNKQSSLNSTNSYIEFPTLRPLYTLLLYLFFPLVMLHLLWRGLRNPAYRGRFLERFGIFPALSETGCVWIHAVSVGEVQASLPLVRSLRETCPDVPILITTMTPTGSERVHSAFGDAVHHVYLPYDYPLAVKAFLRRVQPRLGVIIETELWPNLFHCCYQQRVPLVLANARMSEKSARQYHYIDRTIRNTLSQLDMIAAQTRKDAGRLIKLGANPDRVKVTGSIKFDINLPETLIDKSCALRDNWGKDRFVWIAASTHEGEDEAVLEAFQILKSNHPELLLVLVPRHPERFDRVATLCQKRGFNIVRRSENTTCPVGMDIYLGDTMGELPMMYAASDVTFIGGSLVPTGGHNPLEPAALGIPIITGPQVFNFEAIFKKLIEEKAARKIQAADELVSAIEYYLTDPAQIKHDGNCGRTFVEKNRGALKQLLKIVLSYLNRPQKNEKPT